MIYWLKNDEKKFLNLGIIPFRPVIGQPDAKLAGSVSYKPTSILSSNFNLWINTDGVSAAFEPVLVSPTTMALEFAL